MVALKLTALFAILSTLALAAPVAEDASAEGTVIPLTKRSPHKPDTLYTRDGIPKADLAWLKAQEGHLAQKMHVGATQFEANTGKKLAFMDHKEKREENLAKRAAAGEALTAEQGGSYWQGPISIGTPAQSFQMDFDTVRRSFSHLPQPTASRTDRYSARATYTGIIRYLGPRYQLQRLSGKQVQPLFLLHRS